MTVTFHDDKDPGVRIAIYNNPFGGIFIDYDAGQSPIHIQYERERDGIDSIFESLGVTPEIREWFDRGHRVTFKTLAIEYLHELIRIHEDS